MSQDPACKGTNTAEALLASGGHLANVFVYVKDGLGSRTFDVPKQPVTLDQSGCKYHPHMLGVMIGQEVKIVNSDPTTHNIHPQDRKSTRLNSSHGYISYAVFCLKKKTGAESIGGAEQCQRKRHVARRAQPTRGATNLAQCSSSPLRSRTHRPPPSAFRPSTSTTP